MPLTALHVVYTHCPMQMTEEQMQMVVPERDPQPRSMQVKALHSDVGRREAYKSCHLGFYSWKQYHTDEIVTHSILIPR